MLSLDQIDRLTAGRFGNFDVACPICGPEKRAPANQRRKVLRIWRLTPAFATYRCARCDLHGYARDGTAPGPEPSEVAKARSEAQKFGARVAEDRRQKARWLWGRRLPVSGTPAERYLREARGYRGPIPSTIGFLPGAAGHLPAMIAAFAYLAAESEPGQICPGLIQAVHLTRLVADGTGKAGTDTDKLMIGVPRGVPIALAPINDGLGLAVTEGIESGLSIFEGTGLGVWAAGSAPFLPALADAIPAYIDTVSVIAEPDEAGRRFAHQLAAALAARKIDHRVVMWRDRKMVHAA